MVLDLIRHTILRIIEHEIAWLSLIEPQKPANCSRCSSGFTDDEKRAFVDDRQQDLFNDTGNLPHPCFDLPSITINASISCTNLNRIRNSPIAQAK